MEDVDVRVVNDPMRHSITGLWGPFRHSFITHL